jgi:hypothetical protein
MKAAVDLRYWILTLLGGGNSFELYSEGYDGGTLAPENSKSTQIWSADSREKEQLLRLLAKEHRIPFEELEVFSGVCARTSHIAAKESDRFVDGIFLFAKSVCIFHALDRRHHRADFKFNVDQVETAKV